MYIEVISNSTNCVKYNQVSVAKVLNLCGLDFSN